MDYGKIALEKHKELKGKISVELKEPLTEKEQLAIYYTPGVGTVSSYVAEHPEEARDYTWLGNNVAVISDGSAVLGLGNIGPYGSLPVMEGKALLFKHFGGIDAVPIILDVHSADEIVAAVKPVKGLKAKVYDEAQAAAAAGEPSSYGVPPTGPPTYDVPPAWPNVTLAPPADVAVTVFAFVPLH